MATPDLGILPAPTEPSQDEDARRLIAVVDDDAAFRKSAKYLLESVGMDVAAFAAAEDFLESDVVERATCVVADMRMPGMGGLRLQKNLRDRRIDTPVIFVSAYGEVPQVVEAMRDGASNFLEKPCNDQQLLDLVQECDARGARTRRRLAERLRVSELVSQLTAREKQVYALIVSGRTSESIGKRLGCERKTVETHRNRLRTKMQARSLAHLIRMGLLVEEELQAALD